MKDFLEEKIELIEKLMKQIPELQGLKDAKHNAKLYHAEGDAWDHTLLVAANIDNLTSGMPERNKDILMWAAIMHDYGKAMMIDDEKVKEQIRTGEKVSYIKHDSIATGAIKEIVLRETLDEDMANKVSKLTSVHMTPVNWISSPPSTKGIINYTNSLHDDKVVQNINGTIVKEDSLDSNMIKMAMTLTRADIMGSLIDETLPVEEKSKRDGELEKLDNVEYEIYKVLGLETEQCLDIK